MAEDGTKGIVAVTSWLEDSSDRSQQPVEGGVQEKWSGQAAVHFLSSLQGWVPAKSNDSPYRRSRQVVHLSPAKKHTLSRLGVHLSPAQQSATTLPPSSPAPSHLASLLAVLPPSSSATVIHLFPAQQHSPLPPSLSRPAAKQFTTTNPAYPPTQQRNRRPPLSCPAAQRSPS